MNTVVTINKKKGKTSSVDYITPYNPIPMRLCACGCGTVFQPARTNQICVDRLHANFKYNHQNRKERNKNVVIIEKTLRRNDRILAKYFLAGNGTEATCLLMNLKADGFDSKCYTGVVGDQTNFSFNLYNYQFKIYSSQGHQLVNIQKR